MKQIFLILSTALLFTSFAFAANDTLSAEQEQAMYQKLINKPLNGFLGFSFTNAVPQEQFYTNLRRAGIGFSIYGGYRFDPVPLAIGAQTDILWFGGNDNYVSAIFPDYSYSDTVTYQNMIIPVTIFARIEPNMNGILYPYLQANFGFSLFSAHTSSSYNSDYYDHSNSEYSTNSEISAAWHYGVSGGVQVKLKDIVALPDIYSRVLLDIGFKYNKGTQTNIYVVDEDQGVPVFTKYKTKTDMLMFQLGIVFQF